MHNKTSTKQKEVTACSEKMSEGMLSCATLGMVWYLARGGIPT